jgi:hypothetical protein
MMELEGIIEDATEPREGSEEEEMKEEDDEDESTAANSEIQSAQQSSRIEGGLVVLPDTFD